MPSTTILYLMKLSLVTISMTKTIDPILAPRPEARPRIYACAIADEASAKANGVVDSIDCIAYNDCIDVIT